MSKHLTAPVYRFTTRDLMTLSTLASMGAVMSVGVGQIGAALRAAVGMPGFTQVLAGLHVLWLVLAAILVPRLGSATAAGTIKGAVELLLGSPHGLMVLIVSIVAGLLIDLVLGICPQRAKMAGLILGAALAAGSNVIVFQLMVRLPAHSIVVTALLGFTLMAMISGAVAGGGLALVLIQPLRRAGVVHHTLLDSPA
jgi:energy-coupling factor transport system substrate-specific component